MLSLWLCFGAFYSVMGLPTDEISEIYGGKPIDIAEVPYMVSLRIDGQHWCGASIIHDRFILSAAHCVIQKDQNYTAVVGITKLNETGDTYEVSDIFAHEKFSLWPIDYDVALLKVSKQIIFNNNVGQIDLPIRSLKLSKTDLLTVSGWGTTETEDISNDLLTVQVPFVPSMICQIDYIPMKMKITKRMMCAGEPGKDSCSGDSGGPLVHASGVQVGITSFGYECGDEPGVYTKVSTVKDWITETIAKNE